jgi:hypothetical protein
MVGKGDKIALVGNDRAITALFKILAEEKEPDAAKDEEAAEDEDLDTAEAVAYGEKKEREKLQSEHMREDEAKAEDEDEPALDEDVLKEAADACGMDAEDPAFQKAFAEGVKYGERLEKDPAEREKLDREHESEGAKEALDEEDVKEAMDAAIRRGASRGEARVVARFRTLSRAAEAVRPVLGPVDVFSFDSASDIYGAALRRMGVDVRRHPRSAWRSIFEVSRQQQAQASMAQDSSMRRDFSGPFAGLNRIKH